MRRGQKAGSQNESVGDGPIAGSGKIKVEGREVARTADPFAASHVVCPFFLFKRRFKKVHLFSFTL
jgi:hypothetical protein